MYNLKLPKVRSALRKISKDFPEPHPLINEIFLTDRKDLFVEPDPSASGCGRPQPEGRDDRL